MLKEASTITDIHNNSDATEVELVSLVTEQIPKYQLRANSAIGYSQCDWLQTPVLAPDADVDLSAELCQETFNYFILSGNRVSQMTRTYHDIEAVTRLLEEKERDLELAAHVGNSLVRRNREITAVNEHLDEQLAGALDEVLQLRHELNLKEDLLHTYADEADSSGPPSPVKELRNFGRAGMIDHIGQLQTKIKKLEEENAHLKLEQFSYESASIALESKERQIVSDALKEIDALRGELKEARENNHGLDEELSQRGDDAVRQQEEITRLLAQVVDMQKKQKQVALENEELQQCLAAANNTQYELTREIQALDDRYQETVAMLNETKDEARRLREMPVEYARSVPFRDSLAAELEAWEGGVDPGIYSRNLRPFGPCDVSPIEWSSPTDSLPESEVNGDDASHVLHAANEKKEGNGNGKSEPRSRSASSLNHRILSTARFVNNKNYLMNSKLEGATPKKQDRPITTPLPIPTASNRSLPYFHRPSSVTVPSSGCACSTPRNKLRSMNFRSQSGTPSQAGPLRIQLARFGLSVKSASLFENSGIAPQFQTPGASKPVLATSVGRLNRSASAALMGGHAGISERAERTWHGVTEAFSDNVRRATPCLGRPGIPGTEDLERAIRKLAMRRESARYMEMEKCFHNIDGISPGSMPPGGRTPPPSCPGSPKSSRTSRFWRRSSFTPKLRIVKQLEGSVTLKQWKNLAERDRTLPTLQQTQSDALSSGIITRDRFAEALSRSRDDSLSSFFLREFHIISTPEKPSRNQKTSEMAASSDLLPQQPVSLACSWVALSISEEATRSQEEASVSLKKGETEATLDHGKENPETLPIRPGNKFAQTPTLYTFTNSRVMNLSDRFRPKSSCVQKAHSAVRCSVGFTTSARLARSSLGVYATAGSSPDHLSSDQGLVEPAGEAKRATVAETFFEENTRTCSTQLGLACLFQEHSVNGLSPDEVVDTSTGNADDKEHKESELDSPSLVPTVEASAFALPSDQPPQSNRSHILWNRSLQRTFLLPSTLPSALNLYSRSDSKNPETPPNSPLTSVPSSASFLLNEILAETTQSELLDEKKEEQTFSSNLLSKLSQIGWRGLQGFRNTRTSVAASTSAPAVTSRPVPRLPKRMPAASRSQAPPASLSKCATAPGSLLLAASVASHEQPSDFVSRQQPDEKRPHEPLQSPGDLGITMRPPTRTDWAELHGSSGTINFNADLEAADVNDDGYLTPEADGSSCDPKKPNSKSRSTSASNDRREEGLPVLESEGSRVLESEGLHVRGSTGSRVPVSGASGGSSGAVNAKSTSKRPKARPTKKR